MKIQENESKVDLIQSSIDKLDELQSLLGDLDEESYRQHLKMLFGSTLGQHIRHILEFYMGLLNGITDNEVNYDKRKRDLGLETNTKKACNAIYKIKFRLQEINNNRMITVVTCLSATVDKPTAIVSSLYRELVYCQEHCIHHQALIKVGLQELGLLQLVSEDFGVAASTILHKKFTNGYLG